MLTTSDLVHDIALEPGSRFTLREGGKTVGTVSVYLWAELMIRVSFPRSTKRGEAVDRRCTLRMMHHATHFTWY